MKGIEAFQELLPLLKDEPVTLANGFIARQVYNLDDREGNFYMIGSMGLASSIGLGVALAQPDKKSVILDGDGNVLMAMGTLAMISAAAPKNLVHVVIDNEAYESTGKQATLSKKIHLDEVARGTGYPLVMRAEKREEIGPAFKKLMDSPGPGFLLIKAEPSFDSSMGRVHHTPEEIRDRFMKVATAK